MVKESTCKAGVPSIGQENPLEEEMTTQFRFTSWEISWTEDPGGLYSLWGCKDSNMT